MPMRRAACVLGLFLSMMASAQDAAMGALRGTVEDSAGGRIAGAAVRVVDEARGLTYSTASGDDGSFGIALLPPATYSLHVEAAAMAPLTQAGVLVEVGTTTEVSVRLTVAPARQAVTVEASPAAVQTRASDVGTVLAQEELEQVPLNGRRFADLVLLTGGVSQDPRSLTSSANGDLAFGGIRGYQSSYLVDGADNNNAFFAQARGRYRAPYQFSNEVVQEFRVSSNTYGAELGRAGGAVVNIVTRSGSNTTHGTAFYFLRDSAFNARHPFLDFKPSDRQHQFGGTIGGPIKKDRAFYFAGFDQHIFQVPTVVRFLTGYSTLVPSVNDFELSDYSLVLATSQALSRMGGEFRSRLMGNAGFAKVDVALTPHHYLNARLNTSRYWGENNVFFDPASPITTFATSNNGEEEVATESAVASLTSSFANLISHARVQFSRDLQQSRANTDYVYTRIREVLDGFGRASILPRRTNEHKVHAAETLSLDSGRHALKFGGDAILTRIANFFPAQFGGEYIFDDIRVDPWTFQPMTFGMEITPLRAYAHQVPRYYLQNFGSALSHPDTNEWAAFAQDTIRVSNRFALSLGARYDLQTFRGSLISNPNWPDAGRVPQDSNNLAPRIGFAWSLGEQRALVVRGGYGMFYTRIPSLYTSTVETDNGINSTHLLLDNGDQNDQMLFPHYPDPLAACGLAATTCAAPASLAGRVSTEISAFAHDFQIPMVQQASLGVEREVGERFALAANYMYVHGEHLIRARDVNLPAPNSIAYPLFDSTGTNFTGDYYTVNSFGTWETLPTFGCSYPPCLNNVERLIPQVGAINVFESAASSVYHGLTLSARRRMSHGLYFRLAYTFARAMDDGQDALVAGRPVVVENSYSTRGERGLSVTDQRHRLVASWVAAPQPFHRDHPALAALFNNWSLAGVFTFGSGRPINARILGDANRDGNDANDRLPGYRRNSFTGPDYATTDLRLTRRIYAGDRMQLEFIAESFNLFNRDNQRVEISDDGFLNTAGTFVPGVVVSQGQRYAASYRQSQGFLQATNAYAPRQVQFAVRLRF